MSQHTLAIDLETYSDQDIKYGVHRYVDTPNFEILLASWAVDDGPVEQADLVQGECIPGEVLAMLRDSRYLKTAFNANFELACLQRVLGSDAVPEEQWECDSVLGLYNSYPTGLGVTAKALGLPQDKQKDARGRRLITKFCKPHTPDKRGKTRFYPEDYPEDWEVFKEYNRQDVVTERAIREALVDNKPGPIEHELWLCDRWINESGVRIDRELVRNAMDFNARHTEALKARAREITGLSNPNSPAQLRSWLGEMLGRDVPSINAATVREMLKEDIPKDVRELLTIRQGISKTSIAKYTAMAGTVCTDGRAHDLFQFYGAQRTGRWAGRNIQLQNLARNSAKDLAAMRRVVKDGDLASMELLYDVPEALKQLVRTALIPADGCRFIVADFSAIEARVIAWLASETWEMEAFKEGKDVYCATASAMFGVPVVKHGINGELRQKGKVATLACGYGGSVGALKAMGADKMGLTDEELQAIVNKWRKASPHIVAFWYDVEAAAMRVLHLEGPQTLTEYHNIKLYLHGTDLILELPSGRTLTYLRPVIDKNRFGHDSIHYYGMIQTTRQWGTLETYGGKLVENIVQAVARDCLGAAMLRIYRGFQAGANHYRIVAHIHDELVIECPKGEGSLSDVVAIMCENEAWNEGLIMNADGFEAEYYQKD